MYTGSCIKTINSIELLSCYSEIRRLLQLSAPPLLQFCDLFVYLQLIWASTSKFVEHSPQRAFWRKNFNLKVKDANTFWLNWKDSHVYRKKKTLNEENNT